jgi:hypothetical protein
MAQERVRQWALRIVPEAADADSKVKRIRCQTDVQVLDTWDAPFLGRDSWCEEMEALLAMHAEVLPARKHTVMFSAEDSAGNILSQTATTILGKNKEAQEFNANNGVKAFADAMQSLSTTMEKVLHTARVQCDSVGKTCETLAEGYQKMVEIVKEKADEEVANAGGDDGVLDQVGENIARQALAKLDEYGPTLLELGKLYLQNRSPAASAIANAVQHAQGKAAS